jgi:hypothetical protein
MDMREQPYTAAALAREADVSRTYVARLCRQGKLEAVKVGGIWIITPEVAKAWLEGREAGQDSEA